MGCWLGLLMLAVLPAPAAAAAQPVRPPADPPALARGYRTRTVAAGWGHPWRYGWPGFGRSVSDVGIYPQMVWFVTDRCELYGEGTAHVYCRPDAADLGGVVGIGAPR